MFTAIERIIVDWCEANGLKCECPEGEWLADVGDDQPSISLTALAYAICDHIPQHRS